LNAYRDRANAAIDHVYDWVNGTAEGDYVSAGVVSDGSYGVPEGLISSFPVTSTGGDYQWRREGEPHLFNPHTVFKLQHSTRSGRYEIFKEYTRAVDDQSARLMTLRGLFAFKSDRQPVPIEEVEPVSDIVRRFATGAISYGSISKEMHEVLAIAMNRIGGKSNTGEGGEDAERLTA
ncbi:glutamate synthase-related protein, partial [Kibdelosporangium lantanae]